MKRILLALLSIAFAYTLQAQSGYWEEAKVPYGGRVVITQTQSNVVYARHEHSIHKSVDFGVTWVRIFVTEVDSLDYGEESLILGPSGTFYKIVYYFDGSSSITRKLFASTDDGQTWTLKADPLPVIQLFELPSGTLVGFDHSFDGRIFRSTDGGASWQHVYTVSSVLLSLSSSYSRITSNSKILFADQLGNRFVYSENDGQSWTEGESPIVFSESLLANSGTIFTTSDFSDPTLYRSSDGGANWTLVDYAWGPDNYPNALTSLGNGKLLLSTTFRLYTSEDDGVSWTPVPASVQQSAGLLVAYPLPNGSILGTQRETIVRSTDEGVNWSFSSFGLHNATMISLKMPSEENQFALTRSGLWETTNRGQTWNRILMDTTTSFLYSVSPFAMVSKDTFAVKQGKMIWASTNGGQSFDDITPADGLAAGHIFAAPNGPVFCSGQTGVLKNSSFGNTWTLSIPGLVLADFETHPNGDLYAVTSPDISLQNKGLWRSHDQGETWEELTNMPILPDFRFDFHIDQHGFLYQFGYADHTMKLAISTDEGEQWVSKVIPDNFVWEEMAVNSLGQIFLLSFDYPYKIITSADQGDSWYYLPQIPDINFSKQVISPDGYLYVLGYNGNCYRSRNSTELGAYIRGQVTRDADLDCSTPDAQEPLENWGLVLEGSNTYYNSTNANGRYTFFVDTGIYTIKAITPQHIWWTLCDSVQTIEALEEMNSDTADFVAIPLSECPLMTVDVGIPMLRRCFDNQVFVTYCNQGTEPADEAWVDIFLDPFLSFVGSAQAHQILTNNTIRFFVGDVVSGDCGQFQLTVYVNCDSTVLGQTHCVTAHAFPDTLCTILPDWSGADLRASVECQDSLLRFKIENDGTAPSQILNYIIIEDEVVLLTGQKEYDIAESLTMDFPANGSTWRIESQQEPGHPFSNLVLAFAEGCGGFGSLGLINQFPVNGIEPAWHRTCVENGGSFDPNDKQGFPIGVGEEHNIRPGQRIDYLIRFQNTGTDTAFTVVIRDTLSGLLDPESMRPGASSHLYTWNLSGQGVINFTFNNIMLPDSNVNEPNSHGFVQFSISPQAGIPLGSVIENEAAIYFDFNTPVITNTTWHTIQKDPLILSTHSAPSSTEASLDVWPNPCVERTTIRVAQKNGKRWLLKVFDGTGNLVAQKSVSGPETAFDAKNLPVGLYWVEARSIDGRLMGNGKLLKN